MTGRNTSSFITRQNRQFGQKCCAGDTSRLYSSLTSSMKAFRTWDPRKTTDDTDHGGVFNFGFSKNGYYHVPFLLVDLLPSRIRKKYQNVKEV